MLTPELFSLWMRRFCAFYSRTLTPELEEIYYDAVQDIPDQEFDLISREIFKNETFFPVAGVYAKYRKERVNLLAEPLWKEVLKEINAGKISLGDCDFSPEVKKAITELGGMARLAYSQTEEMPKLFKEFSRQLGYATGLVPIPELPRLSSGMARLNYG